MSQASERDLLAQSLSGDWRSRLHLYKKFFHDNSQVRRMGAQYASVDDFLHDCFTNAMRARQSVRMPGRLAEWVEGVAAWTALERERLRGVETSGPRSFVRMCAAIESDQADSRPRSASYVPPRAGTENSLTSRISAIVGDPPFTLLRSLAVEGTTWDAAAATAGKPVNTIGPILVRAADRLSRYFGAPPLLNDDLQPVFSEVSAQEADGKKGDRSKPQGRVISMQLDLAFYVLTPELRRIGITVPSEVRTIALWDAARASAPPGEALRQHLDKCHYCSEVLRSFVLMQRALLSGSDADFRLCPGASTLVQDLDDAEEAVRLHLDACELCRDERMSVIGGDEHIASRGFRPEAARSKPVKRIVGAAVAALVLGGVIFAGSRYFRKNEAAVQPAHFVVPELESPESPGSPHTAAAQVDVSPKYTALVEKVSLDDERVLASVLPRDQLAFIEARNDLRAGNSSQAKISAQQLANRFNDPGAQMLYAECQYMKSTADGYREMLKAEAMPPRNSFRCWVTLQSALIVADTAVAEREIGHLSSDAEYGPRARSVLIRMHVVK